MTAPVRPFALYFAKFAVACKVTLLTQAVNDPEITAVSVCTPNKMHPIITCDFLRAGRQEGKKCGYR